MKQLSHRRKKFCELYVKNNYNARRAYMEAYETDNENVASVGAHQMLKDERVLAEIKRQEGSFRMVGLKFGLNKETMVKKLLEMMDATKTIGGKSVPDNTARFNAIMGFARLTGDLTPERSEPVDKKKEDDALDLSKLKSTKDIIAAQKQLIQAMTTE